MSNSNSLKANLIYNILYQIFALIVPLITAPYISRVIGAEGLGVYGYTYSIAHYFVVFIMLGIINYGNREISIIRYDSRQKAGTFWNIYINQFALGCLFLCLYYLYILFFCQQYKEVFFIQSFYVISGIFDISWFYFGIEKYKLISIISVINKILTTISIFLFVNSSLDINVYTLIISLSALFNNVLYWILLPKYVDFAKIELFRALSHLKSLLILFLPVIAINIYRYISKVLLGSMTDVTEVGIYDAAEKFVTLPLSFIAAVGTVMLSRIAKLTAENDTKNISRYNQLSMLIVMIVGIGVSFGLEGISKDFIPLFYGEDFVQSSTILRILVPTVLFISWSNVIRNQYLLPNKKDSLYCLSVFVGAAINIVSNIILIPWLGARGAALSTLLAELSVCLVQSAIAIHHMDLLLYAKNCVPYMIIGLAMYFIISLISAQNNFECVIYKIGIGAIVYLILSVLVFLKNKKIYFDTQKK